MLLKDVYNGLKYYSWQIQPLEHYFVSNFLNVAKANKSKAQR